MVAYAHCSFVFQGWVHSGRTPLEDFWGSLAQDVDVVLGLGSIPSWYPEVSESEGEDIDAEGDTDRDEDTEGDLLEEEEGQDINMG